MADFLQEVFGRFKVRFRDLGDGSYAKVFSLGHPIDSLSGALIAVSYGHHEIHDGSTFFVSYKTPDGADLADNASIDFVITTGAKSCHAIAFFAFGGDAEGALYEDVNFGTDGNALTEYNRNRASSKVATASVVRNPTISDAGTLLENVFGAGGTGGNALGASTGQRNEWVLAPSKSYLYRIINRAGNAQPASLELEWYEKAV